MNFPKIQINKADDRFTGWSLILGISIWFADLNTVYALPSLACQWGWFPFTIAGIPSLVFIEAVITLIALLLISFLIYLPWKNWRKFQTDKSLENPKMLKDTEKDRRSLLAFVAMLMNSFFLLFIIASFVCDKIQISYSIYLLALFFLLSIFEYLPVC
jgi:MFS family permease